MKIECVKEKLKNAVTLTERITGKNLTLPVLNNILFTAEDKFLKVSATNLDVGLEITIPANISKNGSFAIQGNIINNLLSYLNTENLFMEVSGGVVSIITPSSKTNLKTNPHDDFPTLPRIKKEKSFSIDISKIIEGLKSVWFSASLSDIKPEIASVYMYSDSQDIVFVATDSFRLAEKKIKYKTEEKIPSILIPIKNILEIIRVFDGVPGYADVLYNKNQLSITYKGVYITTRIIDGVFPDYKQILPKEHTTEAVVLKQELNSALKINNLFADKFNQVIFNIDPPKKTFNISSKNIDIGENTIMVEAALSGEGVKLGFNQKYIIDCFSSVMKDSVVLRFYGENKPLILQGVGDKSFTYLVMPLNQ